MLLSRQQRVTMRCAGSATANDNVMPRPVTRTQRSLSGLSPACQPAVQHHTPTHTRLHPQDSMPAPRQQQLRDTPPLDFGDVDRPPANPELAASRQKLSDVLDADYWRQLCPWLHVCDEQLLAGAATIQLPAARLCDLAAQIDHAGVAQAWIRCALQHTDLSLLPARAAAAAAGRSQTSAAAACLHLPAQPPPGRPRGAAVGGAPGCARRRRRVAAAPRLARVRAAGVRRGVCLHLRACFSKQQHSHATASRPAARYVSCLHAATPGAVILSNLPLQCVPPRPGCSSSRRRT